MCVCMCVYVCVCDIIYIKRIRSFIFTLKFYSRHYVCRLSE